jgi:CspA family cold shock protein
MTGTVKRVVRDKGFGFVKGVDGVEYFMHRSSAPDFDEMNEGDRVQFEGTDSPKGKRCVSVQLVN